MNANQWRLQDAKTLLSQVVEAALHGEPQHITRNGKQAVVVLSEQAFESLQRSAQVAAPVSSLTCWPCLRVAAMARTLGNEAEADRFGELFQREQLRGRLKSKYQQC
jgi:prevent-host-death family protein